jgi:hypothetical protein
MNKYPHHPQRIKRALLIGFLASLLASPTAAAGPCDTATSSGLYLLEPIGNFTCIPADVIDGDAIAVMKFYLSKLLPWMLGLAASVAVLMVAFGGVQIIFAPNQQEAEKGKQRIIAAIVGLVVLAFSATILQFLNYTFFTGPQS